MRRNAFEAALQSHQRRVFTYAFYLLSNREEAEDVAQEAFMRLWTSGGPDDERQLEPWLLRVTRNVCIDRLRRRSLTSRFFVAEQQHRDPSSGRTSDPEVIALASEYQRSLRAALADLREPLKSVVILREIEGLAYRDIAATLGLSLASVRVHLHRARRALREQLKEVYADAAAS